MHPSTEDKRYDAVIIGSGQAGNPLARALAGAGLRTALVEREHVGGTCINEGCTPTKTMVASARVAYLARRGKDYGVNTGPVAVDMSVVRRRKRDIVNSFRDGNPRRLETTEGVDLIFGTASFLGPDMFEIIENNGGAIYRIKAERIFINTGGRPSLPKVEGLENIPFLDSTSIMELGELPDHLIALGGGYIGLEFGQMFRRFGSRVTIIQRGEKLLAREDDDISEEVAKILREDGLELLTGATTRRAERLPDGQIRLTVATKDGERTITGSHLLVSSGRVPNTEKLNLAAAGIQTDKNGFIVVNERLETNVPGVYALGDVKGGPAFTHISYDDYRIIRANLLEPPGGTPQTTKNRLLPYTCFIDPQLGHVGLNETEAKEQGINYKVAKIPMNYIARALEMDESRGLMKAIVDADSGLILGATVLGIEGGEMMAALQMAIIGKVPYTVLKEAVFAHPTLAESFNTLFYYFE